MYAFTISVSNINANLTDILRWSSYLNFTRSLFLIMFCLEVLFLHKVKMTRYCFTHDNGRFVWDFWIVLRISWLFCIYLTGNIYDNNTSKSQIFKTLRYKVILVFRLQLNTLIINELSLLSRWWRNLTFWKQIIRLRFSWSLNKMLQFEYIISKVIRNIDLIYYRLLCNIYFKLT